MQEVYFLFDNQLINEIELLIKNAKKELLLVSPFIDLDERIRSALGNKKADHRFKLRVLFGKNEHNVYKSVKKDSFDFLKEFPNIEIRYNHRLHAKFYMSETTYIMTSMNLYDYSLAKNIEVGVINQFSSNGIVGKALDDVTNTISSGVGKVKQDVLGIKKDVDPLEEFEKIFNESELMYQTEPIIENKKGIAGMIGGKKLIDKNIVVDNLQQIQKKKENKKRKNAISEKTHQKTDSSSNLKSASQLSKSLNINQKDITSYMKKIGFINDDRITELGLKNGLEIKKYMGRVYIAYPENLQNLKEIK